MGATGFEGITWAGVAIISFIFYYIPLSIDQILHFLKKRKRDGWKIYLILFSQCFLIASYIGMATFLIFKIPDRYIDYCVLTITPAIIILIYFFRNKIKELIENNETTYFICSMILILMLITFVYFMQTVKI